MSEEQKKMLNRDLNIFFEAVSHEIEKHNIRFNLYLSGSLARGEPSTKLGAEGNILLNSDIDFVLVCDSDFKKNKWLTNITDEINFIYPKYESSFLLTDTQHVSKMKSFVGRDLFLSSKNPIVQMIENINISNVNLEPANYLEAFVNVLSCFFLHPNETGDISESIVYKAQHRFYIKTVLEGLRLQFFNEDLISYTQLYYHKESQLLTNIITPEKITQFLYSREYYDLQRLPRIDLIKFSQDALNNFYNLIDADPFICIENALNDGLNTIMSYRYALICYILSLNQDGTMNNNYIDIIVELIMSCTDGKEVCKKMEMDLNCKINKSMEQKLVIYLLRYFRLEYLKRNYYVNTGIEEIPDLKQKYKHHLEKSQ